MTSLDKVWQSPSTSINKHNRIIVSSNWPNCDDYTNTHTSSLFTNNTSFWHRLGRFKVIYRPQFTAKSQLRFPTFKWKVTNWIFSNKMFFFSANLFDERRNVRACKQMYTSIIYFIWNRTYDVIIVWKKREKNINLRKFHNDTLISV